VGTLYNHFETRESLFTALMASRKGQLEKALDDVLDQVEPLPFVDQLTAFLIAASEQLEARQTFWRIFVEAEHMQGKTKFAMETLGRRAERLVQRGVKLKVLRADDAEFFPMVLMGLIRSSVVRRLFHGAPPLEGVVKPAVRFFLEGAGRR
jgi:AcrR family transcriptional regulator